MNRFSVLLALAVVIGSACSGDRHEGHGLHFELVDSLVVDMLEPLFMDDYSAGQRMFLLKGKKSRQPFLVDIDGKVIRELDILNDGPEGVGSRGAFGYKFLGNDRFVAQGFYTNYHIYNLKGEKENAVPFNAEGLFRMTLYTTRTTFHPFMKDGQAMMVGEEPNSYNPAEISYQKLGAEFYHQARTLYAYNLETEENKLLETYPEEWEPRANNRFVGESAPLLSFSKENKELAILPKVGNQLFLYDYSGEEPLYKGVVTLNHKHRPIDTPAISNDDEARQSDYPSFSDIRHAGEYILIQFHTQIPSDILKQIQTMGDQYYTSPEFKEAHRRYNKPYYIVIKNGEQIGSIDNISVKGSLNFADDEGYIYFNDNIDPDVERDYNVFYKVRIKE